MAEGNGGPRFSPLLGSLDPESRAKFLEAHQFFNLRVWAFLNAEIAVGQGQRLDPVFGLLALADSLIEVAQAALEARQALLTAGGDVDVAALLLGIQRVRNPETPGGQIVAAKPKRRPRRRSPDP